jgi:2-dehydrotetronate isomerase
MLRFAANLSMMYTEVAFLDRFTAAARDGFRAVEYLFPYDYEASDLAAQLEENALEQVLFNAPPGDFAAGERGIACLPERAKEFRESMKRALDYAEALNCPRVHVMAGISPHDASYTALRDRYVTNLAWTADLAAEQGIEVLIEPINQRDMPGYFLNRQEEAHAIVAEANRPNLKVQMDLYHCQIVEGDLETKLRRYLGAAENRVAHLQVAGVPDRHEPDRGEVNFSYLLDVIDGLGFQGWIGCEYRPRADTSEGLDWLKKRGALRSDSM